MVRLLFLSSISLVLVACGDDVCGPGSAPEFGLAASSADVTLVFGGLVSGQNNDCPDASAPAGVISLTLQGMQQNGPGLITVCIPRPDLLAKEPAMLGSVSARIIDLNGEADGCSYAFESTRPVAGTLSASGLCDNGANKAGYAITVDGALSLRRVCPTTMDTIAVSFDGTVAVSVP